MEKKFFREIENRMDVKTLNDFECEIRTKINDELELERKKNDTLSQILLASETNLWERIRNGDFSWLKIA